jgi:hypothetical protein
VKRVIGTLLLVAAGCGGGSDATQSVQLASLTFDVPASWERHDANRRQVEISEWAPDQNPRRESITVIRTLTAPAVASAGQVALPPLLAASQKALANARTSRVTSVTTDKGLAGARVEVDFVPPGLKATYHRTHVVLLDGFGALVHVLYTAREPNAATLNAVLASIHRGDA